MRHFNGMRHTFGCINAYPIIFYNYFHFGYILNPTQKCMVIPNGVAIIALWGLIYFTDIFGYFECIVVSLSLYYYCVFAVFVACTELICFYFQQCCYCCNPIHTNSKCYPRQQSDDENDSTCRACLDALCNRCNKHMVAEYLDCCKCKQIPRTLPDKCIDETLQPLLTLNRVNTIMKMCASVSHCDIFSNSKPIQLLLPDYTVVTESQVKQCLLSEVKALSSMRLAYCDDLVYDNVPEWYNRPSFNVCKVQVYI